MEIRPVGADCGLTDRRTDGQTDRQTDRQTGREIDGQAGRQIDGQAGRRRADRQTSLSVTFRDFAKAPKSW